MAVRPLRIDRQRVSVKVSESWTRNMVLAWEAKGCPVPLQGFGSREPMATGKALRDKSWIRFGEYVGGASSADGRREVSGIRLWKCYDSRRDVLESHHLDGCGRPTTDLGSTCMTLRCLEGFRVVGHVVAGKVLRLVLGPFRPLEKEVSHGGSWRETPTLEARASSTVVDGSG